MFISKLDSNCLNEVGNRNSTGTIIRCLYGEMQTPYTKIQFAYMREWKRELN